MQFKKQYFGLLFLIIVIGSCSFLFFQRPYFNSIRNAPHSAEFDQNTTQIMDEYFAYEKKTLLVKGMAVGISQNDSIQYVKGFGEANREHVLISNDTIFPIGTLTTIFTIIGIFQLIEAGYITFNSSVTSILPEFQTKSSNTDDITIYHCINHLSGLPQKYNNQQVATLSMKEMLSTFQRVKLTASPGESFQFSLLNYLILGAIIERISNQSYIEYIHSHITQPLNMTSTFIFDEDDLATNSFQISEGYQLWFGFPINTKLEIKSGLLAANGIFSSCNDMTHLLIGIMNFEDTNPYTPILSDESLALFWTQSYPAAPYAYGWAITSLDNNTAFFQSSDLHGFHAECFVVPSNRTGVIVILNTNSLISSLGFYNMLGFNGIRLTQTKSIYARQITLGFFYVMLDLLVAFSLFIEAWRTARLKKVVEKRFEEYFDFRERRKRMIGDLIGEFIGTILVIFVFPWLVGIGFGIGSGFTLSLMSQYQLDFFVWLMLLGGVNMGKAGLQIWYSRTDLFH